MSGKKLAPRTFKVIFEPDGSGWHVYIHDVKGCRSWGRSLTEARRNIREALSTCEDIFGADADDVARDAVFDEEKKVSSGTMAAVRAYVTTKNQAEQLHPKVQAEQARAAQALIKKEKVSLRDAGEFLGLSREGVRKLLGTQPRARILAARPAPHVQRRGIARRTREPA
jgi:predicted RNase H-like HicB family nuclease